MLYSVLPVYQRYYNAKGVSKRKTRTCEPNSQLNWTGRLLLYPHGQSTFRAYASPKFARLNHVNLVILYQLQMLENINQVKVLIYVVYIIFDTLEKFECNEPRAFTYFLNHVKSCGITT